MRSLKSRRSRLAAAVLGLVLPLSWGARAGVAGIASNLAPSPSSAVAPGQGAAAAPAPAAGAPAAAGAVTAAAAPGEPAEPAKALPAPADVAAPPADAEVTASGLASKVLQPGTGSDHPLPADKVKVHYTGWTTDGKAFDSSVARGKPALFPLDKVIAGWTEGVQLMVEGE